MSCQDLSCFGSDRGEEVETEVGPSLAMLASQRLSRRALLSQCAGTAAMAVFGSGILTGCATRVMQDVSSATAGTDSPAPGFKAVAKHRQDVLTIPEGYSATILFATGDPLDVDTLDYRNDGSEGAFDRRVGDHHDGMEYFGLSADGKSDPQSSARGLLVLNHEAVTHQFLHARGATPGIRPAAESLKEMSAHGMSVIEVVRTPQGFSCVRGSRFNRRVSAGTVIELAGPARGSPMMRTRFSPEGTRTRGTFYNCGSGRSPWGTYLSGEENASEYFYRQAGDDAARGGVDAKAVVSLHRYDSASREGSEVQSKYSWHTSGSEEVFARFDVSQRGLSIDGTDDYRNELNAHGYIVELDPFSSAAPLKKRTSLGRMAHESASFSVPKAGKPLAIYMGDDSRNEYLYKFVTAENWNPADASGADPIAIGDKYLDRGILYVAKFSEDGTGEWIALHIDDPVIANYAAYEFADQADVLINARLAADAVGATRMDEPEWCAVHPRTGEIYYTMSNTEARKVAPERTTETLVHPANPRSYADASSDTPGNHHGHIVRIREALDEAASSRFAWDIYLFGAEAGTDTALVNLSELSDDQDFSSPDGLWFSRTTGLCYIQTDDSAYADVTNCMMVVASAGRVGDGAPQTLRHTAADGRIVEITTYVGRKPDADTLRRFLVGPIGCEITGCTETPDGRAIFVNIQHPGNDIAREDISDPLRYGSHWPGNAGYGAGGRDARPRSATVVITRDDGGVIGV